MLGAVAHCSTRARYDRRTISALHRFAPATGVAVAGTPAPCESWRGAVLRADQVVLGVRARTVAAHRSDAGRSRRTQRSASRVAVGIRAAGEAVPIGVLGR